MSHLPEPQDFDVVISGASFAGLALAQALSISTAGSLRICLVDTRAKPPGSIADVRAFALGAASKNVLEGLGIWPQIANVSEPVLSIDITDSPLEAGVRPVLLSYDTRSPEQKQPPTSCPAPRLGRLSTGQRSIQRA